MSTKEKTSNIAMLQGPEWNSSDEEDNVSPKVALKKKSKEKAKAHDKKAKKKLRRDPILDKDTDDEAKVLYVGHLPKEFEERDLKVFLGQFGKVERCRLSRSIKSGNPRGYGFAKFTDPSTATIVAETLQGYFLGNRRLVCHLMPEVKQGTFFDTDKAIARRKLRQEVQKKQRDRNLASVNKIGEITSRLIQREKKKRAKFAELGIEYDFPGYAADSVEGDGNGIGSKAKKDDDGDDSQSTPAKSKRKDSIGSESSATKKSKRKDSIGSESSATKKSKRKDSIGSVGSEGSSTPKRTRKNSVSNETSDTPKSKRKDSVGSESSASKKKSEERSLPAPESPVAAEKSDEKVVQSEKKKNKKKKSKRRISAP